MNRLYVIVSKFIILFAILLTSCTSAVVISDLKQGFTSIHEVKLKKDIIYDRIMIYIARNSEFPKDVPRYNNKCQGVITFNSVVNGELKATDSNFRFKYKVEYKVVIYVKDNKYKIEIMPLLSDCFVEEYYEKCIYNHCLNHFNMLKLDITRFVNGEICNDF